MTIKCELQWTWTDGKEYTEVIFGSVRLMPFFPREGDALIVCGFNTSVTDSEYDCDEDAASVWLDSQLKPEDESWQDRYRKMAERGWRHLSGETYEPQP